MFDILVYTDSAEDESLNGLTGFQFIAHSAGATGMDEAIVREKLQHAVPLRVSAEEWESHPPTCQYAVKDGRMYLSCGRSTGATIGGRPGNQLSVTIMTSDIYDVLPLRPAQLYSSPSWTLQKPGAKNLDEWITPLEIAEDFDVLALHALVAEDAWAAAALPSILTMLEQTQDVPRVKLVIVHDDQRTVMKWIALLSRFLDAEAGLALEFRVFAEDPIAASAHIIGAHPLLSPDLTVERGTAAGVNVLDLHAGATSEVTPSEAAKRHSGWFLAGDPYEALDAIEVSRRWSRIVDPAVASRSAELACMVSSRGAVNHEAFHAALTTVRALAATGSTEELDAYGDALADVIASCPPTGSDDLVMLSECVWSVQRVGDRELAQSLMLSMLEWLAAHSPSVGPWIEVSAALHDRFVWHAEDARAHAVALVAGILDRAETRELPALFVLTARLGVSDADMAAPAAVARLAEFWASNPDHLSPELQGRTVLRSALAARLVVLFDSADQSAVAALRSGKWDWLAPTPWAFDPADPLHVWLGLRELARADAARRADVLGAVQAHAPNAAWTLFLDAADGLDPAEVQSWVATHGSVDGSLALRLEEILENPKQPQRWRRGGGAKLVNALGTLGPGSGMTAHLSSLVAEQSAILALFGKAHASATSAPNSALKKLAAVPLARLGGLYSEWVVKAITESADVEGAVRLADGASSAVAARLSEVLEDGLRAGNYTMLVAALRLLDPQLGLWNDAARSVLDAVWDDKQTAQTRVDLVASVDARADGLVAARLEKYLADQSKGRITRNVVRTTRSLFSGKDQ